MFDFGYVRVSSKDQNEERQRIQLELQGISELNTYVDKQSDLIDVDHAIYIIEKGGIE